MIEFLINNIFWIFLALYIWRTISRAMAKAKKQAEAREKPGEQPAQGEEARPQTAELVRAIRVLEAQRLAQGITVPSLQEVRLRRMAERLGVDLAPQQEMPAGTGNGEASFAPERAPMETPSQEFVQPLAAQEVRDQAERAAAFAFVPAEKGESVDEFVIRTGLAAHDTVELAHRETARPPIADLLREHDDLRRAILLSEILAPPKALRAR